MEVVVGVTLGAHRTWHGGHRTWESAHRNFTGSHPIY